MVRFGMWPTVLLISICLVPNTTAAQDTGDGQLILVRLGDISDGHCRCKDQCETGQSIFSRGSTVAQCERKCQKAFSGCSRGEVRSNQRRDLVATPAPAPARNRSGPAAAPGPHRNFAECMKEMGLMRDRSYTVNLQSGAKLRKWRLNSESQMMTLNDCVTRKAGT
jgi:hypothetical protein